MYLDHQGTRVMEEGKIQNEILLHEPNRYSQKEETKETVIHQSGWGEECGKSDLGYYLEGR